MLERFQNVVYDTNYAMLIPSWGFVVIPKVVEAQEGEAKKKNDPMWWMDSILQKIWLAPDPKASKKIEKMLKKKRKRQINK